MKSYKAITGTERGRDSHCPAEASELRAAFPIHRKFSLKADSRFLVSSCGGSKDNGEETDFQVSAELQPHLEL